MAFHYQEQKYCEGGKNHSSTALPFSKQRSAEKVLLSTAVTLKVWSIAASSHVWVRARSLSQPLTFLCMLTLSPHVPGNQWMDQGLKTASNNASSTVRLILNESNNNEQVRLAVVSLHV